MKVKHRNILIGVGAIIFVIIGVILVWYYINHNKPADYIPKYNWRHKYDIESNVNSYPQRLVFESDQPFPQIILINEDTKYKWESFIRPDFKLIIIITLDDKIFPDERSDLYDTLRKNKNVKYIFSYNSRLTDSITQIPLGIDYHTAVTKKWYNQKATIQEQETLIQDLYYSSPSIEKRNVICIAGWNMDTSVGLTQRGFISKNRTQWINTFPEDLVTWVIGDRNKLWKSYSESAFALCPAGNGIDTHRLWEALYLGCIAIVQPSILDPLMKDFPIIIIEDGSAITSVLLSKWIKEFGWMCSDINIRRKYLYNYWIEKIKDVRLNIFNIQKLDTKCVIAGCVKNVEIYIYDVFSVIKILQLIFNEIHVIIYYDNSTDDTLQELQNIQAFYDINLTIIKNKETPLEYRTHRLALGRNTLIDTIYKEHADAEYFIMMDMDNVNIPSSKFNPYVIQKYINRTDWDCLTFGVMPYYDIWALNYYPFIFNYLSIRHNHKNTTSSGAISHYLKVDIEKKLNDLKDGELIEVSSAFSGFGIYRTEKFINCKYNGNDIPLYDDNLIRKSFDDLRRIYNLDVKSILISENCEHVSFHVDAIKKNNAKIRIAKDILIDSFWKPVS